jgi:hypothetical protein
VAAVVLVGGSWTLYRLTGPRVAPGPVPVLHADDRPVKVRPANPGGMKIPDQNIYVLNSNRVVDPRVEQLLPPPETPLPPPEPASPAPAGQGAAKPPPTVAPPPPPAPSSAPAPAEPVAKAPPQPTPATKPAPPPARPAAPAAAAPVPRTAVAGGYRLQVGAVRSAEGAKREWERLKRAQPDLLGSLGFTTERVDLKARGVFYRILAGPIAEEARAERACNELKRRNVGCILVRP